MSNFVPSTSPRVLGEKARHSSLKCAITHGALQPGSPRAMKRLLSLFPRAKAVMLVCSIRARHSIDHTVPHITMKHIPKTDLRTMQAAKSVRETKQPYPLALDFATQSGHIYSLAKPYTSEGADPLTNEHEINSVLKSCLDSPATMARLRSAIAHTTNEMSTASAPSNHELIQRIYYWIKAGRIKLMRRKPSSPRAVKNIYKQVLSEKKNTQSESHRTDAAAETYIKATIGYECNHVQGAITLALLKFKLISSTPPSSTNYSNLIQWNRNTLYALGTSQLAVNPQPTLASAEVQTMQNLVVRKTSGKKFENIDPDPDSIRGGYSFCKADLFMSNKHSRNEALSINLLLNDDEEGIFVPILYPESSRSSPWIYEAHEFNLYLQIDAADNLWRIDGPTITVPEHEFIADQSADASKLPTMLRKEYGNIKQANPLRPRELYSPLKKESAVSQAFIECVDNTARYMRAALPAHTSYRVSAMEIACTFMCEGGFGILMNGIENQSSPETLRFYGFGDIGVDSYVTRWKNDTGTIKVLTHPSLQKYIDSNINIESRVNESGEKHETFVELSLTEAVFAVGAMYAMAKHMLSEDLDDPNVTGVWAGRLHDLPLHVQFFWATVYHNVGHEPEKGQKFLKAYGLEWHDLVWEKHDDHLAFRRFAKYNAALRTSTFRLLSVKFPNTFQY